MPSSGLRNFFYAMGFSLKMPLSMSINIAAWSHVAFIFLSIALMTTAIFQLNVQFEYHYNVLAIFTIWLIRFLTFVCLTSIAIGRKKEALFWDSFETISRTNNIQPDKSTINWCRIKLSIFVASLFFPMIRVVLMFLRRSEGKTLPFMALTLLHIMTMRVVTIKLIYFSGKLEVCLEHVRSLLNYQIVPIGGSKTFKKLWKLCWQMNRLIESVVGMPIALLSGLVIPGTILNTYTAVISFYNKKLEIGAIMSVIGVGVEICIVSKTCHNCFSCYRSVKGLILRMHKEVKIEAFVLQLMHQKISFAPLKMFTIDHMFVVSVSLIEVNFNYMK